MDKEEEFLSTPSARRATFLSFCALGLQALQISIHALREEGDDFYNYWQ